MTVVIRATVVEARSAAMQKLWLMRLTISIVPWTSATLATMSKPTIDESRITTSNCTADSRTQDMRSRIGNCSKTSIA